MMLDDKYSSMSTEDIVATLTDEYRADGIVLLPRSAVVRNIKDRSDASVDHDSVRAAFEDQGWAYSKHLYYHPEELTDRAGTIVDSLRNAGRLVVAETEVLDRVADPTPVGTETGWRQSDAIDQVRQVATESDWEVERATKPYSNSTRERVFYYRPLRDAVATEHPNGRGAFSTTDIFSWYLSQSVRHETEQE